MTTNRTRRNLRISLRSSTDHKHGSRNKTEPDTYYPLPKRIRDSGLQWSQSALGMIGPPTERIMTVTPAAQSQANGTLSRLESGEITDPYTDNGGDLALPKIDE